MVVEVQGVISVIFSSIHEHCHAIIICSCKSVIGLKQKGKKSYNFLLLLVIEIFRNLALFVFSSFCFISVSEYPSFCTVCLTKGSLDLRGPINIPQSVVFYILLPPPSSPSSHPSPSFLTPPVTTTTPNPTQHQYGFHLFNFQC
jgi:hypothetical protein